MCDLLKLNICFKKTHKLYLLTLKYYIKPSRVSLEKS